MANVKVLYKDYNEINNKPTLSLRTYATWDQEGEYTFFFNSISEDSLAFIIPTRNVCWIRVTDDGE